jgi:hypothetical protein
VDATILKKKKKIVTQYIKKISSKVAHNPTRPRVFSPASFCFKQMRQFYMSEIFSSLKLSNFAG